MCYYYFVVILVIFEIQLGYILLIVFDGCNTKIVQCPPIMLISYTLFLPKAKRLNETKRTKLSIIMFYLNTYGPSDLKCVVRNLDYFIKSIYNDDITSFVQTLIMSILVCIQIFYLISLETI